MIKKIEIPDTGGTLWYDAEDVLCLEALDQYTLFYVINEDKKERFEVLKASYGIGHFEPLMAQHGLLRVARNGIVNPQHVRQIMRDRTIILRIDCARFLADPDSCKMLRLVMKGLPMNVAAANAVQLTLNFGRSLSTGR